MKKKLLYLTFCVTYLGSLANAQDLRGDNLAGYKQINYYIDQNEEANCAFCQTPFTKQLVQEKLRGSFSSSNIPATLITKYTYPLLSISVFDPSNATAHATCGYQSIPITANEYIVAFYLIDIINGKKVIIYQMSRKINTVNSDNALEATAYWKILNTCIDGFLTDWKSTH